MLSGSVVEVPVCCNHSGSEQTLDSGRFRVGRADEGSTESLVVPKNFLTPSVGVLGQQGPDRGPAFYYRNTTFGEDIHS